MANLKKIVHRTEEGIDKARFKIKDKLNLFDPVIIFPYYGYGTSDKAYLYGRILEKERFIHNDEKEENNFWINLRKVWKRYESDEVPGVDIEAEFNGSKASTTSDGEGYFSLVFEDFGGSDLKDGWHEVNLRITHLPFDIEHEEEATGEILISRQSEQDFGIISDVDDTIIKSHAMNPLQKFKTMLTKDAETRLPFDGVEKLYEQLIDDHRNPLFFISGSSYNIYDMLTAFCRNNDIPQAPFLLRTLGLNAQQWIKQDTKPYKKEHINEILRVFDKLSFICIGDSGQQDPEIYTEVHRKNPGRIKAIYIRHVHTDERKRELEKMAEDIDIPFLVMMDSKDALEHARGMDWLN